MKRKLIFVLTAVAALILALGLSAAAATEGGIEYTVRDGEAIVTGWRSDITVLKIPATLKGYPVTEIDTISVSGFPTEEIILPETVVRFDDYSFSGLKKLRKINIPAGVTKLPDQLFKNCESLSDIELPQGLESIAYSAFENCTSLKEIVLPDGLRTIGQYAFRNTGITEIVLPKSIEATGGFIVDKCNDLERIVIKGNLSSSTFTHMNNIKTVIIEEGVESLENAFYGSRVENMTIPGSLTYLGHGGFPETVERLTFSSFNEENFLAADMNWEIAYAREICIEGGMTRVPDEFLSGAHTTRKVELCDGVTEIGEKAFYQCENLESVSLPEGLKKIGKQAFSGSKKLELKLPGSLESMGDQAMAYMGMTEFTVPENLVSVGEGLLYGCFSLKTLTVGSNIGSIKELFSDGRFMSCYVENLILSESITEIPEMYAINQEELKTVTARGRITKIGDKAFRNCKVLESVDVPEGLESVGLEAFYGCELLNSFSFPATLKNIGGGAFRDCSGLTGHIDLSGVKSIGERAFYDCDGLTKVSMAGCSDIGKGAFERCSALEEVVMPVTCDYIGSSVFEDCVSLRSASIPGNYHAVPEHMFDNCVSLESVSIPDSVNWFGDYAFRGCSKLTEIYIPAELWLFGEGACYDCTSLERVELSDANRYLTLKNGILYYLDGETLIFSPAKNLAGKNLILPYDVKSIRAFAFANSSIKKLTIPSGTKDIDYSAFTGSPSLLLVVDQGSRAEMIARDCRIDYIYSNANRQGLYFGLCDYMNGTIYASVVNDSNETVNAVFYVAMLDYNGNFLGAIRREVRIAPTEKYTEIIDEPIEGTRKVKVMLWDENMGPLIKKWNKYDLYF